MHDPLTEKQSIEAVDPERAAGEINHAYDRITAEVHKVIVGQDEVLNDLLTAMFCNGHALVVGVEEAVAPESSVEWLPALVLGDEDHERRQVVIITAESVAEPGSDGRPPGNLRSGLKERDGGIVIDGLSVQGAHEAQLIDDLRRMRQEFADPRAALSVTSKVKDGPGEG